MTNKKLTEQEAQELANLLGCWIAVDESGFVYCFTKEPYKIEKSGSWCCNYYNHPDNEYASLFIRIPSTRPWTEQIWRPE